MMYTIEVSVDGNSVMFIKKKEKKGTVKKSATKSAAKSVSSKKTVKK